MNPDHKYIINVSLPEIHGDFLSVQEQLFQKVHEYDGEIWCCLGSHEYDSEIWCCLGSMNMIAKFGAALFP